MDVTMPQLGETVTEGTITRWLKQVGDRVEADEPLFEVSTDKVDSEVPAPVAGVVTEILVPEGETVEVGTRLGRLGDHLSAPPAVAPAVRPPARRRRPAPRSAPGRAGRGSRARRSRRRPRARSGYARRRAGGRQTRPSRSPPPAATPRRLRRGSGSVGSAVDVADRAAAGGRARSRRPLDPGQRPRRPSHPQGRARRTCFRSARRRRRGGQTPPDGDGRSARAVRRRRPRLRAPPAPAAPAPPERTVTPPRPAPLPPSAPGARTTRSPVRQHSAAHRGAHGAVEGDERARVHVGRSRLRAHRAGPRGAPGRVEGAGGLLAHVPAVRGACVLRRGARLPEGERECRRQRARSCTAT